MSDDLGLELDMAYDAVKEGFPRGETVDWTVFAESFCDLPIPEERTPEWTHHVQMRNRFKNAINERAARDKEPWRLYVQNGYGVFLEETSVMVQRSTVERVKKVGNAFTNIGRVLEPMLGANGLTSKDRRLIRDMSTIADGARIATAGMIHQLSIPQYRRTELLENLGYEFVDEDD